MLSYFFKISVRNILRNKVHSIINILGLALGITCSLVIFLVVNHEFSYDQFHTKKDRIFRVTTLPVFGEETFYNPGTPFPVTEALRNNFPEIEQISPVVMGREEIRIKQIDKISGVEDEEIFYRDNDILGVDSTFFKIFDWKWISGSPGTAFKNKHAIVLSEKLADKFFRGDALGKTLTLNGTDLSVVGIVENPHPHTSVSALAFVPSEIYSFDVSKNPDWGSVSSGYQNFILLKESSLSEQSIAKIEKQLTGLLKANTDKDYIDNWSLELQSLTSFHFDKNYFPINSNKGDLNTLWALFFVGIFILLIASINYINLSTALVVNRSKEVGVRKVLGSSRKKLILFFLMETSIIVSFSLLFALGLTELSLIKLKDFINIDFEGSLLREAITGDWRLYLFIFGILGTTTLLSGFYPAFVLSGYAPVMALKNKFSNNTSGLKLRRSLVIFQFLITQVLIIATLVVMEQLSFFKSKDLGFNTNAIITFRQPFGEELKSEAIQQEMLKIPGIKKVGFSASPPISGSRSTRDISYGNDSLKAENMIDIKYVDKDYFEVFHFNLLGGKFPERNDTTKAVVNESFIKKYGFTSSIDIIGESFNYSDEQAVQIVGVIENFHMQSFHTQINPLMMVFDPEIRYTVNAQVEMAGIEKTLAEIEKIFRDTYPGKEFKYSFLDEDIRNFYNNEERVLRLLNLFAGIAIFIGCLGLYGLVSFMAIQKTKEVGIRKVLGASISGIVLLFSKEFVRLVLIATILAAPIGYFMMNEWLATFNYKIELGPKIFLLSGLMAVVIALITISYQAIKTAVRNPVNSLRSE
ncbi:ABC transporter permease [Flexithrix dorotheae]|uniref:ABC transporter permease n=1 Tax=Flexithrix dorotheae TaxID=70993 RepID=UPI00036DF3FC|nr:ABC transporter permease [Flexithrix dorotheae]